MRIRHSWSAAVAGLMLTSAGLVAAPVQTPEPLEDRARKLYSSAEYEETIALVGNSADPGAQQYRVLCLVALGRQQEAKAALDALVSASPDFAVSEDMPPRFLTMLSHTRQQVLPSILRGWFAEARERYQVQAYDQARSRFEQVLALTSHAAVKDIDDIADLRLLADGYLDLLKDLEVRKPPATPAPPAATPTPAVAVAPVASAPATIVTPAAAIKQVLPPWPLRAGTIDRAEVGLLRVRIGPTGQVLSATMIRSVHPLYDWHLLASAKRWQYKPATRDGSPIESESTVEIRLK
jgi:hypothetical protein